MRIVNRFLVPALMGLVLSAPVAAATPQGVITEPKTFEGPDQNGEVPLLSGKGGGKSGRSPEDAEKNRRILNELCKQQGASSTLDRLGPMLWDGEDAKNQGNCI